MAKDLILKQYPATQPGGLNGYIAAAYALPVLNPEEERALAVRYHDKNDLEAARKLVTHNLRFVIQVARGYAGYGLPLGDLIQEGNVGLMKAVKKFDPNVGVRLISFAVHWIRAEMHEFILRNWRVVKVATTKAQRKLFFNLRSMKKRLGWLNQAEVNEVATQLGVKPEEVTEMEKRLSGQDLSFDPAPSDEDENDYAPAMYLTDQSVPDPAAEAERDDWRIHSRRKLKQAMAELDERSLDVLKARRLPDGKRMTLHELAARYRISAERVRQIENQAVAKLQKLIAAPAEANAGRAPPK